MYKRIQCLAFFLIPVLLMGQNQLLPYQLQDEAVHLKKRKVRSVEVYSTEGRGEEMLTETRTYFPTGLPEMIRTWDDYDGLFVYKRHTYNNDGLLIMRSEEAEDGYILSLTEFKYAGTDLISMQYSSVEYGAYTVYYIYGSDDLIDSSYVADAEPRINAYHYSNGRLDSIEGFTIYDYENPDDWVKVEVESFEYDKKGKLARESFCGSYSGCYTHDYSYKKKRKVLDIVSSQDSEIFRSFFDYSKKLLVRQEKKVSEEMSDMMEDEVLRYEYKYY